MRDIKRNKLNGIKKPYQKPQVKITKISLSVWGGSATSSCSTGYD